MYNECLVGYKCKYCGDVKAFHEAKGSFLIAKECALEQGWVFNLTGTPFCSPRCAEDYQSEKGYDIHWRKIT